MHEYYFKIRKGDIEFECSTTDQFTFEKKLSDWINGLVQGNKPNVADIVDSENEQQLAEPKDFDKTGERSGFIDVKKLASINDMQTIDFNFNDNDIVEQEADFAIALNDSINNPMTEVIEKADEPSSFNSYYEKYSPEAPIDKLIVAALYILNEEHLERFSIKQINSKIVPISGTPVDHSAIQEAIEQGYIRIVPDLTETSEYTEYTLTDEGEGYFVV